MKNILAKYVSFLMSLTALSVMISAVSATAETTSTTAPMYTTYTHSSKSAVRTHLSNQALKPSSNIKPPVNDYEEIPTQQVVDHLGDDREIPTQQVETPTQVETAQRERVQQQQPKGAGESQIVNPGESQDTDQQARFRAMPTAQPSVSVDEASLAAQPSSPTTKVMPTPQQPVQVDEVSLAAQSGAKTTRAMPKAKKLVPPTDQSVSSQPVPGTAITSATSLNQESSISLQNRQALNLDSSIAQTDITPGRPTRAGYSYFGVGGNIGITGSGTSLARGNFAILSKIGLTNTFSVRPAVVFGNDTTFLLPVTYDFSLGRSDPFESFSFAPYFGGGVAYSTNGKVGFLVTTGIDVPLSREFTATAALNVSVKEYTDLGLILGLGYNFVGF